jgi:hypothetical protein
LKKNKFDLVVSGDNHKYFFVNFDKGAKERNLINIGSMLRKTIAQKEHTPFFVFFDTKGPHWVEYEIPIESADKVFADNVILEKETEVNEHAEMFINGLEDVESTGLDFLKDLKMAMKNESIIDKDGVKIIEECLNGINQ